jgi:hypothetical protein
MARDLSAQVLSVLPKLRDLSPIDPICQPALVICAGSQHGITARGASVAMERPPEARCGVPPWRWNGRRRPGLAEVYEFG